MNRSDQQLIADYFNGDEKALEIIFERYLGPIYSFIYRYISGGPQAEDITQEVFVKAWRNLKNFDQKRIFKIWIFAIAKNSCLDFLKKKKAVTFSEFEDEQKIAFTEIVTDSAPLPLELLEKADLAQALNAALEKLSPKYRMVLFLRYNDHFNFREIAESLGQSLNTVKSCHWRALIKLKKLLTD